MKQENNSILLYDHIFHLQQKNELKGSLLVFDNREMLLVALRLNYIKLHVSNFWFNAIGHFRIVLCLFFKAKPRAKPFI